MSEPYIKLHMWMAKTGLNPSELIIFAVIHNFTESGGSYYGSIATLREWTGCSERTIQGALKHLVQDGWIIAEKVSRGRHTSVYSSNPAKIAGLIPAESAPQPRRNCTVNPAESAPNKIIDKININTPYSPPTRGTANADATLEHKPRTRKRPKNRALEYEQGPKYTRDDLKALGISLGEEIYEGFDELRIE